MDSLGRVVPCDSLDPSDARCGIALALGELSPKLSEEEVKAPPPPKKLLSSLVRVKKCGLNLALRFVLRLEFACSH